MTAPVPSSGTYSVVTENGASSTPVRGGLSHAAAMSLAEKLRSDGQVVRVMHTNDGKSHEVDHYPAR